MTHDQVTEDSVRAMLISSYYPTEVYALCISWLRMHGILTGRTQYCGECEQASLEMRELVTEARIQFPLLDVGGKLTVENIREVGYALMSRDAAKKDRAQ